MRFPCVVWGFWQPTEDNIEEAVRGVKGELATKVCGDNLRVLADNANEIAFILSGVRGITGLGVLPVNGSPILTHRGHHL